MKRRAPCIIVRTLFECLIEEDFEQGAKTKILKHIVCGEGKSQRYIGVILFCRLLEVCIMIIRHYHQHHHQLYTLPIDKVKEQYGLFHNHVRSINMTEKNVDKHTIPLVGRTKLLSMAREFQLTLVGNQSVCGLPLLM